MWLAARAIRIAAEGKRSRALQLIDPAQHLADRFGGYLVDREVDDGHGQRLWLQPTAVANRACTLGHIPFQVFLDIVRRGLAVAALQVRNHPLEVRLICALLSLG